MCKSADDLELSCDETVLLNSDADIPRQYANLILHTAGDERDFITCLSALASAIRYRLKNIMKPMERPPKAVTVSLAFFILYMTRGYISLAYGSNTGAETLYQSRDLRFAQTLCFCQGFQFRLSWNEKVTFASPFM